MISDLQAKLDPKGPVVTCIRARFADVLAIYAFGSQLSNVAGIAGCMVDLLDLRAATTVMQYQVISTGLRLWSVGLQADLFECYVLSAKTALDTARAPLLADIAASGKVHG